MCTCLTLFLIFIFCHGIVSAVHFATSKDDLAFYKEISKTTRSLVICASRGARPACQGLRFEDQPNYAYLRWLLRDIFFRELYQYDFIYDWTISASIWNSQESDSSETGESTRSSEQTLISLKNELGMRKSTFIEYVSPCVQECCA